MIKSLKIESLPTIKEFDGQIVRIIYQNKETGYTIALLKVKWDIDPVTIMGNMVAVNEGEFISVEGDWEFNKKYNQNQFKISKYKTIMPTGIDGIEAYLSYGYVVGIGPEIAKRVVQKFGEKTFEILDSNPERLLEVSGIGKVRIEGIKKSWNEQKKIRDLVIFLAEHDISGSIATKIYNVYGEKSIEIIKSNPYVLVRDIRGIGFHTADRIAQKIGFPLDSVFRAEAALLHTLYTYADEGHSYAPMEELIQKTNELIKVDEELIINGLDNLNSSDKIVVDITFGGDQRIYLSNYYRYETESASMLKELLSVKKQKPFINYETEFKAVESKSKITLAPEQKDAIESALNHKVVVITGGPGVGKTTIINSIIEIYRRNRLGLILLATPTGKAAKRMTEVTGLESKTIHRLLEYDPETHKFNKFEANPLDCDMLICDESSMIDEYLFYSLIRAIPRHATFVMVGDIHQLPSVGVGNVLKDVINSEMVKVVTLNKIFRQAAESLIIVNSHRVNNGEFPKTDNKAEGTDFFYIERNNPSDIKKLVLEMVTERIPKKFKFDPMNDIQVLAPMYKGEVGINELNIELQKKLNFRKDGLQRGNFTYAAGDKVMQIKNNYDKDVFNGDIGVIDSIINEEKIMKILFDGRLVAYAFSELDEIVLAYATSVHKSQGSEYPAVVIPLHSQHYMLLQRNLLYTGITRGKKLVVLIGEKKAVAIAVKNNKTRHRYTALTDWIKN